MIWFENFRNQFKVFFNRIKFLKNVTSKITLVLILTIAASSASVYTITYNMLINAALDDIKERSSIVNDYVHLFIDSKSFWDLNSPEDENKQIYVKAQAFLNEVRILANIKYLFTAKINDNGQLIYVIDGLDLEDKNFRHIGDLIEPEFAQDILHSLDGNVVNSDGIIGTDWGNIYATYWPVTDADGNVAGTIGMYFDMEHILHSYSKAGLYSVLWSSFLVVIFILISRISLRKLSEPFYKKLAYNDFLTDLPNRLAFENRMKFCDQFKHNYKISIIVFDLNDLKKVNDSLGHNAGDIYLKNSALAISEAFKPLGQTYRIGGDEFSTIVMRHSDEKIQQAIDTLMNSNKPVIKNFPFNSAYGIATFDADVDYDLHSVFERADGRMYECKRIKKEKMGGAD